MLDDKYWAVGIRIWNEKHEIPLASALLPLFISKPQENDFVLLNPGQSSIEVTRDISQYYKWKPKNLYEISIETHFLFFKKSKYGCIPEPLSNGKFFHNKWDSGFFESPSLPARKLVSIYRWINIHKAVLTEVSKKLYITSKKPLSKFEIEYIEKLHISAKRKLQMAINAIELTHKPEVRRVYKRWFGEPENMFLSVLSEIYKTALKELSNQPSVYAILPDFICYQQIFGFPFFSMTGKKQPLINICGRELYYHDWNEALFYIIRAMVMNFSGAHTEMAFKISKSVNYRETAVKIAKANPQKAITMAENIAFFSTEVPEFSKSKLKDFFSKLYKKLNFGFSSRR